MKNLTQALMACLKFADEQKARVVVSSSLQMTFYLRMRSGTEICIPRFIVSASVVIQSNDGSTVGGRGPDSHPGNFQTLALESFAHSSSFPISKQILLRKSNSEYSRQLPLNKLACFLSKFGSTAVSATTTSAHACVGGRW